MKLVRLQFKKFSQGADIKADIAQGWCAGVTAMVSHETGDFSAEEGQSETEWIQGRFQRISALLDGINNKSCLVTTRTLQSILGTVNTSTVRDVTGSIHRAEFNGRGCKVLLSTTYWIPVVGYVSYAWNSTWRVNHIGYVIRVGNHMLLFDPNYGLGLLQITDNKPLTLDELTKAVRDLAWANSAALYYLTTTAATAVVDEDALGMRLSHSTVENARRLAEMASQFRRYE